MIRNGFALACLVFVATAIVAASPQSAVPFSHSAAPAGAPIVTMSVTLPDGRVQEFSAHESGAATVALKDGTEYAFRPTIQDSSPWNRIVVTIFKQPTATTSTQVVGEVETRRAASPVDSRTSPPFKIAVTKVSSAATSTNN